MNYDKNTKELKDSVVCFIDILGFSDMIMTNFKNGNGQELLNRIHKSLSEANSLMKEFHKYHGNIKVFTDNIVVGKPIIDDGESELGMLFNAIASYQLQLALEGFFIRGGITVGEHYMDDDIVFGPALIEAYKLESYTANMPRVILSGDAIELAKIHINYYADDYPAPQLRALLIDSDGQWFINYLEATIINDSIYDLSIEWLIKHKSIVEEKLDLYRDNSKLFCKYRWIAQYHNFFCKDRFKGEENLLILSSMLVDEPKKIVRTIDVV